MAAALVFIAAPSFGQTTKRVIDKYVDFYSLNAVPLPFRGVTGYWIDDDQFISTLLRPSTTRYSGAPTNVVLIDFAAKSVKILYEGYRVFQFDVETREAYVANDDNTDIRSIRIRRDGSVMESRRLKPNEVTSFDAELPKDGRLKIALRKRDGYLLYDSTSKGEQWLTDLANDVPVFAIWIRPGKPPLRLNVRYNEVRSPEFVEFLNKYLLNSYNTQGNSDTDSHMRSKWTRPYEFTPYRLLGLDGTIEEIPYPRFPYEYGIADPPRPDGTNLNFNDFLLTKAGIVVSKLRSGNSALYLFQNNQLYRLSTAKWRLPWRLPSPSVEGADRFVLSPEGCKLAYQHYDVASESASGVTPKYLTIVNVCETKE